MADFKGGRGKRVPYKTVMYRIPAPIKPVVEMLGHTYRLLVDEIADPTGESLIKRVENAITATGYEPQPQAQKLQMVEKDNDSDDEEDDLDDEEDDLDIDEEVEPSPEERLKFQVERNHALLLDIRLCERELTEVKEARSQLDKELDEVHARNGDLNLQILELKEHLRLADIKLNGVAVGSESKPDIRLNGAAVDSESKPDIKLNGVAVGSESKPDIRLSDSKPDCMSQRKLAKRLKVSRTTIQRRQKDGKFAELIREHDPDQLRWRFDPESKLYCPVD